MKSTIVIDRTIPAPAEKVWKMWTTKEGLERWWGPEGFSAVVKHLDVRVGGRFEIEMTANVPAIVAHLESIGVGKTSVAKGDYSEVETGRRLAYTNAVDFVPGVAPYAVSTVVELTPAAGGATRLVVTNDAMHDAAWTERARAGWEQQIGKLARTLG